VERSRKCRSWRAGDRLLNIGERRRRLPERPVEELPRDRFSIRLFERIVVQIDFSIAELSLLHGEPSYGNCNAPFRESMLSQRLQPRRETAATTFKGPAITSPPENSIEHERQVFAPCRLPGGESEVLLRPAAAIHGSGS